MPRGQPTKRKRASEPEPEEPPRRRTSDRIREMSVTPAPSPARPSPLRRSTRASTAISEDRPPARPASPRRQFARRSGGPLPARSSTSATAPAVKAALPPSRVVVELPTVPQTPRRNNPRTSGRVDVSLPASQSRPRPPSSASRRRVDSSSFSVESEEDSEPEEDMPEAGPGPNTRALRASANTNANASASSSKKALHPVPQPDPEMFHKYMRPPSVPAKAQQQQQPKRPRQVIVDLSGSRSSGSSIENDNDNEDQSETLIESLPPHREVTVINGEEAYVIADSDSGDENAASPQDKFDCPVHKCMQVLRSQEEIGRHLRAHADMYDPRGKASTQTAAAQKAAERKELAEREKEHLIETGRMIEEINGLRFDLSESMARAAAATQSASQLTAQLSTFEEEKKKAAEEVASLKTKLAERDTKITALEAKIRAAEEVDRELEQIAAAHAPLDGDVPSTEIQIKLLHKKIKRSAAALKSAQDDIDFFRSQYQNASNSALAEVKRANELEEQAKKLQEKLTVGLKQRDLHAAAVAENAKLAAKKSQQQLELLLEQSRKTDDAVRRKAAAYSRLTRENQELEAELHKARSRADDLSKRNTELGDQVALLRGRLIGAFDRIDESDDETDDDAPPQPAAVSNSNTHLAPVPSFAPDNQSTRPSPHLAATTLGDGGIEMFRCKWAIDDNVMCPEIFDTRDELEAHGLSHIDKLVLAIGDVPQMLDGGDMAG